ncbi:MAG TPA: GMC family oxidoreductase [Cyclobacteriaceae bacterium]|nr:GMC family oxidoreductase [Cyclobacteriaceae bacterium]
MKENDSINDVNINGKAREGYTYDAIVIGSGMSGGWAAKELCEKGLKTLVLERGRNVEHIKDYPTATKEIWEFPHRGRLPESITKENPVVSRCYAFDETTQHFFVKDTEHPYVQVKPYDWIRGYQVGGKSLMWARMTQRWSVLDFEANARDGNGCDWPIRYDDLAPWYSYVEKFAGISGNRDGLPQIPDGEFLPAMELNCLEKHFQESVNKAYSDRKVVVSRIANLSQRHNDRGPCQYRNMCQRGCPFGGYFSANSATLPAAIATGNMTLRPFSVVHSIIFDEQKGKATGVRVIDAETMETMDFHAKIIFVNASTLNTTLILLNSTSTRFPNGLGNDHDVLGHYLMDHNYRGRIYGDHDAFQDMYYYGRRPGGWYLPRFRNWGQDKQSGFLRGYSFSGGASRRTGNVHEGDPLFGAEFKEKLTEVGPWSMGMTGMGEHLPRFENRVALSKDKKDKWGIPLLEIDCEYGENEENMIRDLLATGAEMMEKAGFKNIRQSDSKQAPGLDIHEMGTARMGRDPKTSMLNSWNQVHDVKNVFVTDGAAMTSSACQNPSLTYMALTARAADYAVKELNKQNL